MSGNNGPLKLRIRKAGATIRESSLDQESLILGSGAAAGVRLDDPHISTLHVMLKIDRNQVTAIDLGSEHGTRVGDAFIRQPMTVNPGDVIRIGGHEIELVLEEPRRDPSLSTLGVGLEQPPAPAVLGAAPAASKPPAAPPAATKPPVVPVVSKAPAAPIAPKAPAAPMMGGLRPRNTFQSPVGAAAAAAAVVKPELNRVTRLRPTPHIVPKAQSRAEESAWRLLEGPLPSDAAPTPNEHALQVSQLWGDQLLAVEHFGDNVDVKVGEARRNMFSVYAPSVGASHVLASSKDGKMSLHVPAGANVVVYSGNARLTREALSTSGRAQASDGGLTVQLSLEERARVELGTITFFLRHVKPSAAVTVHRKEDGGLFVGIVAAAVVLVGSALAVLSLHPVNEMSVTEADQRAQDTYVHFLAKKKAPPPPPTTKKVDKSSGVKEGAKAKDEEGKMGKPEAKAEEAAPSRKGTPRVDKKKVDRKKVMASGLLGAVKGSAASDVFGPGGLGTGINKALGGLKGGAALSDARGIGGLGTRGKGAGAGGTGLGIGGLGTKGMGHGAGGYGTVDLGGKGHQMTRIIPGKTTVVGGLSREVIERVIRQHQSEIKYCYEMELNQRPDLAGKVAVSFTIDGSGAVSTARVSDSTLHDPTTEQCMLSKIKRWRFPNPVGGGQVDVNFPWIFKPAG